MLGLFELETPEVASISLLLECQYHIDLISPVLKG